LRHDAWLALVGRMVAHWRKLRAQGRNPHILVLQEAFIPMAQSISASVGYSHVERASSANMNQ